VPGHRFLGYLQNHDQVGNRATGERSAALMSPARLKVGAAVVLLAPFVPMLFQGEEWAASTPFQYFTDHSDRALGEAVSKGRREEFAAFGWDPERVPDPQDPATFERSRLRWSELNEPEHAEMLEWHRRLIRLRREHADLADYDLARVKVAFDEDDGWLWFARGSIALCLNIGRAPAVVGLGATELLLASDDGLRLDGSDLWLPPDSVAVVRRATS
jgi:maltooligosyltrehalose trehalohydrolase